MVNKFYVWLIENKRKVIVWQVLRDTVPTEDILQHIPCMKNIEILQNIIEPAFRAILELSQSGWTRTDFERLKQEDLIEKAEEIVVGPPYPRPPEKPRVRTTWRR